MVDQLTPGDFLTPTWRKLEAHLTARMAELRESNDQDLDDRATARTRGAIAEIKNLLALDITKPGNRPLSTLMSADEDIAP